MDYFNDSESPAFADVRAVYRILVENGFRLIRTSSISAPGTPVGIPAVAPVAGDTSAAASSVGAFSTGAAGSVSNAREAEGVTSATDAEVDAFFQKERAAAERRAELAKLEDAVENKKLIAELKRWRRARADEAKVPAYFVLSQKTLLLIAANAPATEEELLGISGFGPNKASRYGADILNIVASCMEEV